MNKLTPKYKVEFIDNYGHWYVIDGVKYPSVTKILENVGSKGKIDGLMGWAKKISLNYVADELKRNIGKNVVIDDDFIDNIVKIGKTKPAYELEKAADLGTRLHNAVDYYIINGKIPDELDSDIKIAFDNFLKYMDSHKLKIVCGDITLGSKKYSYGGRADCIAQDENGNYVIIDWKTSKTIKDKLEYKLQVSAYAEAFREMFGINNISKAYIVRFSKEIADEFEVIEVDDIDKYFKGFQSAIVLKDLQS